MSTESIVNRVSQTVPSGYSSEQIEEMYPHHETATLTKPTGAPTELVEELEQAVDIISEPLQESENRKKGSPVTAAQQRAGQVGSIEDDPSTIPGVFGRELDKLKASRVKPDTVDLIEFQEFKRQVIATFKHLGVDVRKHFTE